MRLSTAIVGYDGSKRNLSWKVETKLFQAWNLSRHPEMGYFSSDKAPCETVLIMFSWRKGIPRPLTVDSSRFSIAFAARLAVSPQGS